MNINYLKTANDHLDIKLQGEMDALGCMNIRPKIETIADAKDNKNITIDMSNVSFIDSSGIGVIVFLYAG